MQHDHILKKLHFILGGHFGPRGIKVEDPQGDATYQRPCGYKQDDVFMFSYLAYVNTVFSGVGPFLAEIEQMW